MQNYSYSIFSIVAIVIHLIINFDQLIGRGDVMVRSRHYRGFLFGVLAYYITDATWGLLAGLGWTRLLYADTILFFLALVAFVFAWSRFVINYLELGKWASRVLICFVCAILAFNLVALVVNPFNNCFFHIDDQGIYQTGCMRDPAFYLLVAFNALMAVFVMAKAAGSRDVVHRRSIMVFLSCLFMAVAIALQIIWPLTPFTALGCLIGTCFMHVFVIQDEHTAKHMADLEKALARARAAEKSRSMFFSIVSHDIRTPLNAIIGYSELLRFGLKSQSERDEALESIRASGTTLLQLVNDVLDLAKMDSGTMTLQPEPVRLSKETDDVFATFRLAAAEKGIELINRTADVPKVMLDEHRFRQILFNLVGNAVKFTAQGSVTVAASYSRMNLEVSVSDTGCGIPSDMLTHILDPFVQVQDPSHVADRTGGTGLGLSICKRLVEAMGGEIFVESELGKGSMFRVLIPSVKTSEEKTCLAVEPKPSVPLKDLPKHVLVVDDSAVNRSVLTAHLKRAGVVSIDQAGDGAEAFSKIESESKAGSPYDLVFSDFWMPNMNGLEFIEKLRSSSRFSRLPVFAVTADTEFRDDGRAKLFTGVLLKPLTYGKLVEVFATMASH